MYELEETHDYSIAVIAALLHMTQYSIRNALWRYRRQGLTETDFLEGLTSVPPAYRTGRALRWPVGKFEQWKAARVHFHCLPLTAQRELRAKARERAKPGSGVRRKPGRKPGQTRRPVPSVVHAET